MNRFKVLAGNHDEDGTVYSKGQVVETPRDLDKMFVNKFERLGKASKDKKKKKGKRKPKIKVAVPKVSALAGRGKDVTSQFASVEKEGLKVFKRGAYYHVYDGSDEAPSLAALNESALKKAGVEEFVTAHLEE